MFRFKINVGTSHFSKSRTCNCVGDTLNKYEILKNVSAFFQITDFCWAMHRFPCQNTNFPTFPEHICWNLCMAQPKKSIWTKNALIFSRISYLSMCHLHSYMFLLLKMWCSQVAFGNEHAFWERTFFFWYWKKYIIFLMMLVNISYISMLWLSLISLLSHPG